METSCYWRLRTSEGSDFLRVCHPQLADFSTGLHTRVLGAGARATDRKRLISLRRRGLSSTERGDDIGEFVDGNVSAEQF